MSQTVGHLDFFPNGGKEMPGCEKNELISHRNPDNIQTTVDGLVACNHLRSIMYYSESVLSPDGFIGYPGSSYSALGSGFRCPSGGCPWMGHYADRYAGVTNRTQTFYLNTGAQKRFSRWRYRVSVRTAGSDMVWGDIAVSLQGSNGQTLKYTIYSGLIYPDTTYTDFIDAELEVGLVSRVTFIWRSNLLSLFHRTLAAPNVTVQYGKDGSVSSFCGSDTAPDNTPRRLRLCTA
ncbi:Pancreatic lipase-related protein, partial [Pristimantis euphronides]